MTARKAAKSTWQTTAPPPDEEWRWPLEVTQYDRSADLSPAELREVAYLAARRGRHGHWPNRCRQALARLRQPVVDALAVTGADLTARSGVLKVLLRAMVERRTTYWAWSGTVWRETLGVDSRALEERYQAPHSSRHHLIGVTYLLGLPLELDALGPFRRLDLTRKVFGRARVDAAIRKVSCTLAGWGYRDPWNRRELHLAVCEALLANRSPRLEDLTLDGIERCGRARLAGTCGTHSTCWAVPCTGSGWLIGCRPRRSPSTEIGIPPWVCQPSGSRGASAGWRRRRSRQEPGRDITCCS